MTLFRGMAQRHWVWAASPVGGLNSGHWTSFSVLNSVQCHAPKATFVLESARWAVCRPLHLSSFMAVCSGPTRLKARCRKVIKHHDSQGCPIPSHVFFSRWVCFGSPTAPPGHWTFFFLHLSVAWARAQGSQDHH
mmetsp:Transcript_43061/g.70088  ORF Transcript_43061/g.70088 Transcript_43061/m.70088 type:complete len:135 (+) Transcript_43061:287-691(+)